MKPILVIHLLAPSDKNGKPRRLYLVVTADGDVKEAIDEGHAGDSAYRNKYGKLPEISISTTATEYKDWLKTHGTNSSLPGIALGFNPKKRGRGNLKKLRIRI